MSGPRSLRTLGGALLAAMLLAVGVARAETAAEITTEGESLYRHGAGADGAPLRALVAGGAPMQGAALACAGCHRRSGYGSVEGDEVVPAIAGPFLFTGGGDRSRALVLAGQTYGGGVADSRSLRASETGRDKDRPAYDDATLARAIREGVDAAGAPLSNGMPRYDLDDDAMAALIAYLRSMTVEPAPGVDERTLHLATVIAGPTPESRAQAIRGVLRAMVADHNGQSRHDRDRSRRGPWYKDWQFGAYRDWKLHEWRLTGDPQTWEAQLQDAYDRQPVFAVVSGAAAGDWAPIHDFCESRALPCLFPLTDRPALAEDDFYTVYFTRGEMLDAELALDDLAALDPAAAIMQVVEPGAATAADAAPGTARAAAGSCGDAAIIDASMAPPVLDGRTAALLWLGRETLGPYLARHAQALSAAAAIYVFADRVDASEISPPASLRGKLRLIQPFETRDPASRHLLRTTAWLRARRVPVIDAEAQADAYFAGMTTAMALTRMRGLFSREHLLEKVEHIVDNSLVTSIYPRLTLGPGQRYGSRGGYVLRFGADGAPERSEWRAPDPAAAHCRG